MTGTESSRQIEISRRRKAELQFTSNSNNSLYKRTNMNNVKQPRTKDSFLDPRLFLYVIIHFLVQNGWQNPSPCWRGLAIRLTIATDGFRLPFSMLQSCSVPLKMNCSCPKWQSANDFFGRYKKSAPRRESESRWWFNCQVSTARDKVFFF